MDMPGATVGELSEGEILAEILAVLGPSHAELGPGDDAAVLAVPSGRIVASVDTLVHGPDFRLSWTDGFSLGWKAAAVNLADIAAMGARPTALLVALAVPADTPLALVTDLARGLRACCDRLAPGCAVEGGDLTVSDTLTVAVTALGEPAMATVVTRSGARPGDRVALAGDVGRALRGLQVLFERFRDRDGVPIAVDPDVLDEHDRLAVAAQLRPCPPVAAGVSAAQAGASAMMDVSDGLALDASRLAEASGVTIALDRRALGPDPDRALAGGEDHALLAVFPETSALADGFRPIGWVRTRGEAALTVDGVAAGQAGWDPYRDWDSVAG